MPYVWLQMTGTIKAQNQRNKEGLFDMCHLPSALGYICRWPVRHFCRKNCPDNIAHGNERLDFVDALCVGK